MYQRTGIPILPTGDRTLQSDTDPSETVGFENEATLVNRIEVPVADLMVGMYVGALDRPWLKSPFALQGFPIRSGKDVQQLQSESHLRWDSMGEFCALGESLNFLADGQGNAKAGVLGAAAEVATQGILDNNKSPSRKVGEPGPTAQFEERVCS